MSSGSRMRRPMPRCAGSRTADRPGSPRRRGSSGSTTTIRMRHTSRRRDLAERFRVDRHTTERSRSSTASSARLLQALDASGETGRTIVLVTADHGESLGEHGEGTHGIFIYDATLRVPWVMAGPRHRRGRASPTVARSIDVLPTLARLRRASRAQRCRRPLAAARRRGARDGAMRPTYAESLYPELELGWAPLHAWRTAGLKFIKAPHAELYDLEKDPPETTNRVAEERARVEDLDRKVEAALRHPAPSAAAPAVDPEAAERLRALGYASGGRAPRPRGACAARPQGWCPSSAAAQSRHVRGANGARARHPRADRGAEEDPGLLMARRTRAVAYAAAGRHELAIADLRLLDKEGQLTPEDAIVLGDNLQVRGPAGGSDPHPRTRRTREPDVSAAADLAGRSAYPGTQIR